jgi:DNA modification methylase
MALQRDIRSSAIRNRSPEARAQPAHSVHRINGFDSSLPAGISGDWAGPNLAPTTRVSVSLSPLEYVSLRALASSGQRSLGWVMRHALQRFLEGQAAQFELPLEAKPLASRRGVRNNQYSIERLANMDWQGLRRRTAGTIHNLHPYPTRFAPAVPAKLIETLSAPGDVVLDPFCGSGTTLIEARRLGRSAIGVDLSPLAVLISRVKNTRLTSEDYKAAAVTVALANSLVSSLQHRSPSDLAAAKYFDEDLRDNCRSLSINTSGAIPGPGQRKELLEWFPAHTLQEIMRIRVAIEQCPLEPAKNLLLIALSLVLLPLSYQKSDTRLSKTFREIEPQKPLSAWKRKVVDIQQLLAREQVSLSWPQPELHEGDARNLEFLQPSSIDLVVTSPPYPETYDYAAFQRLRLLSLGLQRPGDLSSTDNGFAGRYKSNEIRALLISLSRVLKPTGICAFVVCRSFGDIEKENGSPWLAAAVAEAGFLPLTSLAIDTSSTAILHRKKIRQGERILVLQRC